MRPRQIGRRGGRVEYIHRNRETPFVQRSHTTEESVSGAACVER